MLVVSTLSKHGFVCYTFSIKRHIFQFSYVLLLKRVGACIFVTIQLLNTVSEEREKEIRKSSHGDLTVSKTLSSYMSSFFLADH